MLEKLFFWVSSEDIRSRYANLLKVGLGLLVGYPLSFYILFGTQGSADGEPELFGFVLLVFSIIATVLLARGIKNMRRLSNFKRFVHEDDIADFLYNDVGLDEFAHKIAVKCKLKLTKALQLIISVIFKLAAERLITMIAYKQKAKTSAVSSYDTINELSTETNLFFKAPVLFLKDKKKQYSKGSLFLCRHYLFFEKDRFNESTIISLLDLSSKGADFFSEGLGIVVDLAKYTYQTCTELPLLDEVKQRLIDKINTDQLLILDLTDIIKIVLDKKTKQFTIKYKAPNRNNVRTCKSVNFLLENEPSKNDLQNVILELIVACSISGNFFGLTQDPIQDVATTFFNNPSARTLRDAKEMEDKFRREGLIE